MRSASRDTMECPLCGGDNQCRVAKGHLYKGPCWCHEMVISGHIPRRLAQDFVEQTCLCPTCLETVARLTREYCDPERAVAEIQQTLEEEPQRRKTTILRMAMLYSRLPIISTAAPAAATGAGIVLSNPDGEPTDRRRTSRRFAPLRRNGPSSHRR